MFHIVPIQFSACVNVIRGPAVDKFRADKPKYGEILLHRNCNGNVFREI